MLAALLIILAASFFLWIGYDIYRDGVARDEFWRNRRADFYRHMRED